MHCGHSMHYMSCGEPKAAWGGHRVSKQRQESSGARSSVLRVLLGSTDALTLDEISHLATVERHRAREILRQLANARLVTRANPTGRAPSLHALTPLGIATARSHLRLAQLREGEDRALRDAEATVDMLLERYQVAARYRRIYRAIGIKYLLGVPIPRLVDEFGSYQRVRAALHLLRIPLRTNPSGTTPPSVAHPSD
jgi:hypothetical protein